MQADVLVNSLGGNDKDLNQCGVIAKAFLGVVGQKLQDDFDKTGGLKAGEVAATDICDNLKCKLLLHLGLEKWKGIQSKEVIKYV